MAGRRRDGGAGTSGGCHFRDRAERHLFATKGRETIFTLPPNVRPLGGGGLAVSPDEQTILYAHQDNVSSDLMLVEGLQ